jgi:UDP-2-acetamido-2,6-beta-L-arabino-hexul-4-ose reductase
MDNPYGRSKKAAEDELRRWAAASGGEAVVFRISNVFGKWCRPNYNSVVATFCHNVAHGIPLTISDPGRELDLVYVDDVVQAFVSELNLPAQPGGFLFREVPPIRRTCLRELAGLILSFHAFRETMVLPDFGDRFVRCLHATYLSYLDPVNAGYPLARRRDSRGALAEIMKSPALGQVFVSTTRPGIVRGNHYHDTKVEKFLVLSGEAEIRLRPVLDSEIVTHRVSGADLKVVDIPPGVGHCIENVGTTELVVLFWASEPFDPAVPDAYPIEVSHEKT